MGYWGCEPCQNDRAADWFDGLFDATGLAHHLEETLHRTVEDGADEIRAAAFIILALDSVIWPPGVYERCAEAARSRLTEMIERQLFTNPRTLESVQRQLASLKGTTEQ